MPVCLALSPVHLCFACLPFTPVRYIPRRHTHTRAHAQHTRTLTHSLVSGQRAPRALTHAPASRSYPSPYHTHGQASVGPVTPTYAVISTHRIVPMLRTDTHKQSDKAPSHSPNPFHFIRTHPWSTTHTIHRRRQAWAPCDTRARRDFARYNGEARHDRGARHLWPSVGEGVRAFEAGWV